MNTLIRVFITAVDKIIAAGSIPLNAYNKWRGKYIKPTSIIKY